jgi:hypothetical protein
MPVEGSSTAAAGRSRPSHARPGFRSAPRPRRESREAPHFHINNVKAYTAGRPSAASFRRALDRTQEAFNDAARRLKFCGLT